MASVCLCVCVYWGWGNQLFSITMNQRGEKQPRELVLFHYSINTSITTVFNDSLMNVLKKFKTGNQMFSNKGLMILHPVFLPF